MPGAAVAVPLDSRQGDDHGEASAGGLLGFEGSAHGFGEPAGEGEAESDASGVVFVPEPLERQEDPVPVIGRDTRPAVDDSDVDPVAEPTAGQVRWPVDG